ncbi:hypothetical protein L6164_026356 [Bauhinia variegata]|uniref:Uncharacterized protein n=1 Tax=Bauhinia variegata TaxID=167791 RepID=A0ACB9LRG5_BAUVA|nr:hypothetical protein L6164_026356 [Bauhinia variegata]
MGASYTLPLYSISLFSHVIRKGSPYVTVVVEETAPLCITMTHGIISFAPRDSLDKYTLRLNNGQTWHLYTSPVVNFTLVNSQIVSDAFSSTIRVAILPDNKPSSQTILDNFSSFYPVSGDAIPLFDHTLQYKWQKVSRFGSSYYVE